MPQTTTGIRAALSSPLVYETFQRAVGSPKVRRELVRTHLRPQVGDVVLDIGCGPGDILRELADVEYVGFDLSESYIRSAQQRYGRRGRFFVSSVRDVDRDILDRFDIVIAKSLLHHISDEEATKVFSFAAEVLKPGGRLVTIDACFSDQQSRLSRWVVSQDRGRNIRTSEQYEELARRSFSQVRSFERCDLLRIPYDHVILECEEGRTGPSASS